MFHTPHPKLLHRQAKELGIDLITIKSKAEEEKELYENLKTLLTDPMYFVLQENCGWEGETWYRAIEVTPENAEALTALKQKFEEVFLPEYSCDECPWSVWDDPVSRSYIANQGNDTLYTCEWSCLKGLLDLEKIKEIKDHEDLYKALYKCGIGDNLML